MRFYIDDKEKEFNNIDDFLDEYKNDDKRSCKRYKILDFKIGGGTGSKIEEAYLGSMDDVNDFISLTAEYMTGWVETGDAYRLAWHDGYFVDIFNSLEDTLREFGEEAMEHFEEESEIVWYEFWDEDLYIFGIY